MRKILITGVCGFVAQHLIRHLLQREPDSELFGVDVAPVCPWENMGVRYRQLDLIDKELTAGSITLTVGYDAQSLERSDCSYTGRTSFDHYGRRAPVHAHGSANFSAPTSSAEAITTAVAEIFDRVVNKSLLIRRLCVTACNVISQAEAEALRTAPRQLDLFTDYDELQRRNREERSRRERELRRLKAVLSIKRKFGKNAILRGLNYGEGATQRERNNQIGGHKA